MKRAVLFRIKPDKEQVWRDWCSQIYGQYRNEAIESLNEEGLIQEMSLLFKVENATYMIGYMDGEAKPSNKEREINKIHAEKRQECLEYVGEAEVLYSLFANQK
ncbi:hypothetical protein KBC99_00545 [Candidatus Saccharibacteria bacterium]|nr:hypothetical protein [Candidatus Saccharibacteria bacterium]